MAFRLLSSTAFDAFPKRILRSAALSGASRPIAARIFVPRQSPPRALRSLQSLPKSRFVLVALEKSASLLFVAQHGVQPGSRRHVAVHIRVVREQAIGDAAWSDWRLRVHLRLLVIAVDVSTTSARAR